MYISALTLIVLAIWWDYVCSSKSRDADKSKQAQEDAALLHRMRMSTDSPYVYNGRSELVIAPVAKVAQVTEPVAEPIKLRPMKMASNDEFLANWNKYMPEKFATYADYHRKYGKETIYSQM